MRAIIAVACCEDLTPRSLFTAVPARRLPEVRQALAQTPEPPRLIRTAYLTALARYARSL